MGESTSSDSRNGAGRFKNTRCAGHVYVHIKPGIFERRSNARLGGQVNHGFRLESAEQTGQQAGVANITLNQFETLVDKGVCDIVTFLADVIKWVKIVETKN